MLSAVSAWQEVVAPQRETERVRDTRPSRPSASEPAPAVAASQPAEKENANSGGKSKGKKAKKK